MSTRLGMSLGTIRTGPVAAMACAGLAACAEPPVSSGPKDNETPPALVQCRFVSEDVFSSGASRDGIPALVNPPLVPATHRDAQYVEQYARSGVRAKARVVGLIVDGTPVAVPHNVLWWHEIVNIDLGGRRVAISFCPLTGSAITFDATAAGTDRFGVSGLIYENNLVMFDAETGSVWPQMCQGAGLGDREGTQLVQVPATEMLWDVWRARHPETLVVSSQTGYDREYASNPYVDYEFSDILLFPLSASIDDRRPLKERVVGIPGDDGGLAIPFGALDGAGGRAVIRTDVGGDVVHVVWDGDARAARVFLPRTTDGIELLLQTRGSDFVDVGTGSVWTVEGRAVDGPLAGATMEPHPTAYVAYWFAWSAFNPNTRLWSPE